MRFWTGVSAAFGAGTLIGIAIGILTVEDKLKKEYAESSAAMRRAYEAAKIDAETPALTEQDLIHIRPKDGEQIELEGGTVNMREPRTLDTITKSASEDLKPVEDITSPPQSDNPYHTAVRQTASNGVYASYAVLSEEDYYDEDGRQKEQITMLFSDNEPIFFKDGAELDTSEAMDMVGSTIVDDMRRNVGDGNPILYMRNNQTEVDYEVLFEQP